MGVAPRKLEGLLFALNVAMRCIQVSTLLHCRANLICCAVRNQQHAWTKAAVESTVEAAAADATEEAALACNVGSASLSLASESNHDRNTVKLL